MTALLPALLAAALAVLGFPPFGLGFLVIPAVALFLWALGRAPSRIVATLSAAAYGIAFYGLLMWWIDRTETIALIALVLSQALFVAGFGWFAYGQRHRARWPFVVSITGGWAAMELLRGWMPVGGLQWGAVGYAMAPYAPARGAAAFIGVSGWTMVIVATAALIVHYVEHPARAIRWVLVPVSAWLVLLAVGLLWPATAEGPEMAVTVVQGNTPCVEHCAGDREAIYENHLRLTRQLPAGSAELVVWGESATGFSTDPLLNPDVGSSIAVQASRIGSFFLVGGDRPTGNDHFVNANMLFGPDGSYLGEYNKRHPVPFGEYVPLRPVFGLIPATSRVPRDMQRGDGPEVFDLEKGTLGSVISFEGSFSRYTRDHVRAGAELMVVATNERSYGIGPAADQLIDMTRMHAAENGIDLIQAAITGKSAIIVNGGEIAAVTDLYEEAVIDGTVRFRASGWTLFTRLGDWVPALAILALVVSIVWGRLSERSGGPPVGDPPASRL